MEDLRKVVPLISQFTNLELFYLIRFNMIRLIPECIVHLKQLIKKQNWFNYLCDILEEIYIIYNFIIRNPDRSCQRIVCLRITANLRIERILLLVYEILKDRDVKCIDKENLERLLTLFRDLMKYTRTAEVWGHCI